MSTPLGTPTAAWRRKLHEVIFEAETPSGKVFDIALLFTILASVLVVMLESVPSYRADYATLLRSIEWFFTIMFSIEYVLRIVAVQRPLAYMRSFFGLVDLFSIIPTFVSLVLPGAQSLLVIRALRLLRVFRVLKMVRYLDESSQLRRALWASRQKIIVFLGFIVTAVVICGSLMYLIEGRQFASIPHGVYWAIVTLTTVGYGDIAPQTALGRIIASVVMLMGYGVIAVPTGIVTAALTTETRKTRVTTEACPACSADGHDYDARHCKYCGAKL